MRLSLRPITTRKPNVFWIASYPKSGNTWVRAFIDVLRKGSVDINRMGGVEMGDMRSWLYDYEVGKFIKKYDCFYQRPAAMLKLSEMGGTRYAKTHSCNGWVYGMEQIPRELTKGAVYIVRDPRDVAVSYAHHLGVPVDEVIRVMGRSDVTHDQPPIHQFMGSWSDHVESWVDAPQREEPFYPVLFVRYEDLLDNPLVEFGNIAKFLELEGDLERAVTLCSFRNLRKQEDEGGFREKLENEKFFRSGRAGDWKEKLTKKQVRKIEAHHSSTMKRFKYERTTDVQGKRRLFRC